MAESSVLTTALEDKAFGTGPAVSPLLPRALKLELWLRCAGVASLLFQAAPEGRARATRPRTIVC